VDVTEESTVGKLTRKTNWPRKKKRTKDRRFKLTERTETRSDSRRLLSGQRPGALKKKKNVKPGGDPAGKNAGKPGKKPKNGEGTRTRNIRDEVRGKKNAIVKK